MPAVAQVGTGRGAGVRKPPGKKPACVKGFGAGRGAGRDRARGRRPKASREGTRGEEFCGGALYGDFGIADGSAARRREGREQGSTALVSVRDRLCVSTSRVGEWAIRARSQRADVKGFGCRPWRRSGQGAGPASESLQGRNPRGGVLWRGALWRFRHRGRECRATARGSRARIDSAGEREGSAVVSTSRVGEWRSGLGRSVRRQV